VVTDTAVTLNIAHQDVRIKVKGKYGDTTEPIEDIKVYLFNASGSYVGRGLRTDQNGEAVFHVPQRAYKVRADYLGGRFWSGEFTWEDTTVDIPMAEADVTVTGAGLPREGVKVYLFSTSGSYLGVGKETDSEGKARFRVPEGTYKFRADYQGNRFWSGDQVLAAGQVNPVNISTGGGSFTLRVENAAAVPFAGLKCYVFNEAGSYIGLCGSTNNDGQVSFDLSDGSYEFRVDYLGHRFWSDTVEVPASSGVVMTIDERQVSVTVSTASGPYEGAKVYLFSENGSYLGKYQATDSSGQVSFSLPVDCSFKFRADILGNRYFSDTITVSATGANEVAVDAGGGSLNVTVEQGEDSPMEGVKVYLFSQSGAYLGVSGVSDASGLVTFDVPQGVYKVRADYLGYRFWSEDITVDQDTSHCLVIAHQQVKITVQAVYDGGTWALEGVKVYLFSPTGSYLGRYGKTDSSGNVTFNLPQKEYRVRVDYLGGRFWSEGFTWQDTTVDIPMARADVTVTGAGLPREGIKVYVFSAEGSYLGMSGSTDTSGKVQFSVPEGTYKFRADYLGHRYWSGVEALAADQMSPVIVSTGGGSFAFGLYKQGGEPIAGARCYVFNGAGSYIGLCGSTDENGQVFYDLPEGTYKFRVDYLGHRFWSEPYGVPSASSAELVLPHQEVTVTVEGFYDQAEPLQGLKVYLFNPSGSYVGRWAITDAGGKVGFDLPDREYKVRADYLGGRFWSEVFQSSDTVVTIDQGVVSVHVYGAGGDVPDARVYLFGESGSYLGWHQVTDTQGSAIFRLPEGAYKFRVDVNGNQHWSPVVTVNAGQAQQVEVNVD